MSRIPASIGQNYIYSEVPYVAASQELADAQEVYNEEGESFAHVQSRRFGGGEYSQFECGRNIHHFEGNYSGSNLRLTSCVQYGYPDKEYRCEYCGERFWSFSSLDSHLRVHTQRRPYRHDVCGTCLSYSSIVDLHKGHHDHLKAFICHICGDKFQLSFDLAEHQKKHGILNTAAFSHFSSDLPEILTSEVGIRKFSTAADIVVSKGPAEKPSENLYYCIECKAACASGTLLREHITDKHNIVGDTNPYFNIRDQNQKKDMFMEKRKIYLEKPFKCTFCIAAFKTDGHLAFHMKRHTTRSTLRCSSCNQAFTEVSLLAAHERKHQVSRPFSCRHCGAAFHRRSRLNAHLVLHGSLS